MRAFLVTCLLVVPTAAEPLPSWVAGWWRVVGKGPEADRAVLVESELISTLHGHGKFLEHKLAAPLHCDEHRCAGALPYFDERPFTIAMTRTRRERPRSGIATT